MEELNSEKANNSHNLIEAHAKIMNILSAIMQMGSTDNSEKEIIEEILKKLREGKITPEEALYQTNKLIESKQDYH